MERRKSKWKNATDNTTHSFDVKILIMENQEVLQQTVKNQLIQLEIPYQESEIFTQDLKQRDIVETTPAFIQQENALVITDVLVVIQRRPFHTVVTKFRTSFN